MPSTLVQDTSHSNSVGNRKIRKGTFSCWECKRRKRRCVFVRQFASACTWCQQKGLNCVGQESDDSHPTDTANTERRLDEIEVLISRLARQRKGGKRRALYEDQIDSLLRPSLPASPESLLPIAEARNTRCRELGEYIYSILPEPEIIQAITTRGRTVFRQHLGIRDDQARFAPELISQPHHLLLATRKLFQLALCLRQIRTSEGDFVDLGLNGSPYKLADHFVEAASHVMSQDFLVRSVEGLETLMMQAYSRIYVGDAKGMRPIFHRALTYGQLLELDKAVDTIKEGMWFQLVYAERFLSLGLGTEPFAADNGFACDRLLATSKITRRLERIHVLIAGRIIARNVRMQQPFSASGDDKHEHKETHDLDHKLKQATKSTPTGWWAAPNIRLINDDTLMDHVSHVLTQMHHYYLIILIHLPYIVDYLERSFPIPMVPCQSTSYSKQVASNASREVLNRFAFFKHINYVPCSFVGMGQKAVAASITLLVLHIEGHQPGSHACALEHQRPQDLCLIEDNLGTVREIFRSAVTSSGYGDMRDLEKLIEVEAEAAHGVQYSTWMVDLNLECESDLDRNLVLKIPIPYFGHICVAQKIPVGLKDR